MAVVAEHIKFGLIVVLSLAVVYQWLRADSAIGYAEGLIGNLKAAQHDIRRLEARVAELEKIPPLSGL